ncbi:MAG TPA: class II aldolase/adducin family protein [Stellaceae bacterium]|jgi:HCOMODA/2-hydroxy-3-carboxy-muconic semialdehyde decarboxylase|nr:class II aldolase/adducin family protein [Stellaceae bacterium]
MADLKQAYRDLVIANRVLAHQNVVDAYGHVSMRHPEKPDHFLLSRSRSPELVSEADIMEFTLDGKVVGDDKRPPYLERFIHGSLYEARSDVHSVVHSHAEETLPFGITGVPLKPVIHVAGSMGAEVPVWDIAEKFGDNTNLLVTNVDQGRDLAQRIGQGRVALMRGHGFAAVGASVHDVVRLSVYLPVNARIVTTALRLAPTYKPLAAGEIDSRWMQNPRAPETWRAWEYWARRAGVSDLLAAGP